MEGGGSEGKRVDEVVCSRGNGAPKGGKEAPKSKIYKYAQIRVNL